MITIQLTPIEALHTAARHYCIEQRLAWYERSRGTRFNSTEATVIHAHARVLEAILDEVERVTSNGFKSLEDMEAWLLIVGEAADDGWTRNSFFRTPVNRAATEAEREQFKAFIHQFVQAGNWDVEPLPYRRVISVDESRRLWARLETRWGVSNDGWYPMTGETAPPHTIVFEGEVFDKAISDERLRSILGAWNVGHVFELSEGGEWEPEYEIELAFMSPCYRGLEGYWIPPDLSWLIYASHHSTITFGGEWLVTRARMLSPSGKSLYVHQLYGRRPGIN